MQDMNPYQPAPQHSMRRRTKRMNLRADDRQVVSEVFAISAIGIVVIAVQLVTIFGIMNWFSH